MVEFNAKTRKVRFFIVIGVILAFLVGLGFYISYLYNNANKNPYGESIHIVNYDDKVKNISKDYKNNIEAFLYTTVKSNLNKDINGNDIKDAYIREGSDSQDAVTPGHQYYGKFIVDIASIKQSYLVTYAYSTEENDTDFTGGYPLTIQCLSGSDVIYSQFVCKDSFTDDSSVNTGLNAIIRYLPYSSLSFDIKADNSSGSLIIRVNLKIPSSYLNGSATLRKQAVASFKKEVGDWITKQGFSPSDYDIVYNYDDNGNLINS